MRNSKNPPVYSQVAYDIASKIAAGKMRVGEKFSGRSLMASEYKVSQETIRRALRQLADLDIISVEEKSGATVLSRENAAAYLEKFTSETGLRDLKQKLKELMKRQADLQQEIVDLVQRIADLSERFPHSGPMKNYEFELSPDSSLIGKTIGQLKFWQNTGATIVAIRSEGEILLSPGPDAVLRPYDILVVTGEPQILEQVRNYIA